MNPLLLDRFWEFAAGTLIRACILILTTLACLLALRKAPAVARHVVLSVLFAGLILLPLVTWMLPTWSITWHTALFHQRSLTGNVHNSSEPQTAASAVNYGVYVPSRAPIFHDALRSFPMTNASLGKQHPNAQGTVVAAAMEASPTSRRPDTRLQIKPSHRMNARGASVPMTARSELIQATVLLVWVIGFGIEILRLAAGLAGAARLRRSARPIDDLAVLITVSAIRCQLGIRRAATVLQASDSSYQGVPVTWGLLRPAILIPDHLLTLPCERMRPILLHEMAHIARFDWPIQIMAQVARAIYWFLPPVRWAARQLYVECEHACDDQVLLAGIPPTLYAETLLEVLRAMKSRPSGPQSVLSMVMPPMEARLCAILSPDRRYALRRSSALLTAAIGAVCVLIIAEVRVTATPRQTATAAQTHATSSRSHGKASHSQRPTTTGTTTRASKASAATSAHAAQIRTLEERLAAVERELARNSVENRQLRVQIQQQQDRQRALLHSAIKVLSPNQRLYEIHERTPTLHETPSGTHTLSVSHQVRIDTLKLELADLIQQRGLLQQKLQRNEALYKSGFAASNPVHQAHAQLLQNQAEIEDVQHNLTDAEAGIQRSQSDEQRDARKTQLEKLKIRLQEQQGLLHATQERYRAGIAAASDVTDLEESISQTKIAIDRLQIPEVNDRNTVFGAVRQPGIYAYKAGYRVTDALTMVGGPTQTAADLGNIKLFRRTADERSAQTITVDLLMYLRGRDAGDLKHNPELQPGDILYVPEKKH